MAEKKDMQKELLELEALELEVTNRRSPPISISVKSNRCVKAVVARFVRNIVARRAKCGPVAAARRSGLKKSRKLARNWKIS